MARWLLLVHIMTHKLVDQVFECCWRSFPGVLGIFCTWAIPLHFSRNGLQNTLCFTAAQIPVALCWEPMHLQDKTMLYLFSRELEQVQRTYRASVVLGSNCESPLLKIYSPKTSIRKMGLLISPFTAPQCTLLTNFNGGSWVTKHRKN